MRRIAFIVAIIGLGYLVSFLLANGSDVESLNGLSIGEVVSIHGKVSEERKFGNGKILIIDKMKVYCECKKNYLEKEVFVEGVIENFPEDLRVRAFFIKLLIN